jgi:hypothetical protein
MSGLTKRLLDVGAIADAPGEDLQTKGRGRRLDGAYEARQSEGSQPGRPPRPGADEIRNGRESQSRESAWPRDPAAILLNADEVIE